MDFINEKPGGESQPETSSIGADGAGAGAVGATASGSPTSGMAPSGTPAPGNGEATAEVRVLLIDDQAMVGEAVRRLLADQPDITLHYTPDPLEAVQQALAVEPTVILLDLLMPNVNGLQVLCEFRANPATAGIPVVLLSITDDPAKKSEAFANGADDYLVKLPDKVELIARIRYHSASYRNLLQRNEAIKALRASEQDLQESNNALTSLNQAYQQAKTEAEHANHAKSDFLSRMSHELRTPLNAILGFGQIMEMEELTERQRESIEHILQAGTHLLALINEMLDIARIESGRIQLTLEAIRVSEVIAETVSLIRPLANDFEVTIRENGIAGLNRDVLGDRQRLRQVMINLLSNAVKYNQRGGFISISGEEEPDGMVRLSISDTGLGIAQADMEKLFQPFERLHTEVSNIEGTGLGLALSKRLMEAMGGDLTASSVAGQGSCFDIRLPAATEEMTADEAVKMVDMQEKPPPAPTSVTRTILLIEDNLSNASLMEVIFASRPGNKLLTAMQARIGLELAERHLPDLILLDLHLPDMDGQDVLKELKANPATNGIPVVIVSADATPMQIEKLLAAGATDYVTKPINVREFLFTINAALE